MKTFLKTFALVVSLGLSFPSFAEKFTEPEPRDLTNEQIAADSERYFIEALRDVATYDFVRDKQGNKLFRSKHILLNGTNFFITLRPEFHATVDVETPSKDPESFIDLRDQNIAIEIYYAPAARAGHKFRRTIGYTKGLFHDQGRVALPANTYHWDPWSMDITLTTTYEFKGKIPPPDERKKIMDEAIVYVRREIAAIKKAMAEKAKAQQGN